jgi:hypothetical protein
LPQYYLNHKSLPGKVCFEIYKYPEMAEKEVSNGFVAQCFAGQALKEVDFRRGWGWQDSIIP